MWVCTMTSKARSASFLSVYSMIRERIFSTWQVLDDTAASDNCGFQTTHGRVKVEFFLSYQNDTRSGYDPDKIRFLLPVLINRGLGRPD